MSKSSFQRRYREPTAWVSAKEVFPAIPHRRLDETRIALALPLHGKHTHGSSDMSMSGMTRIRLLYRVVNLKLIFACVVMVSLKHFQGKISAITNFGVGQYLPTVNAYACRQHTAGDGRAKPLTLIQTQAYQGPGTYLRHIHRRYSLDSSCRP